MSEIITYSADQQLAIFRRYASRRQIVEMINRNHTKLFPLAEERAMTEGAVVYKDASFHKSPDELHIDMMQEAADLLFYGALLGWRQDAQVWQ